MGRVSFLTPTYFFGSIREDSGKSSLLANLAIFWNNSGKKVAILDLDSKRSHKLKAKFPTSISIQEYNDLSDLISENRTPSHSFYFSDTEKISFFPAFQIRNPAAIFSDTTLRDFFIQLKSTFDTILINFPSGPEYFVQLTELTEKKEIWRNSTPASILVSCSDKSSLIELDKLFQQNPGYNYSLRENFTLFFNKVPANPGEQKFLDDILTASELEKIFSFPFYFTMGINEEIPYQLKTPAPIVLKDDSELHQQISYFSRILTGTFDKERLIDNFANSRQNFNPSLDGKLLENLSPYLEKIKKDFAGKLFLHPSEIQIFLEENDNQYRIRLRVSGNTQPLLSIPRKVTTELYEKIFHASSPSQFAFPKEKSFLKATEFSTSFKVSKIKSKNIFSFDDRFAWKTGFSIATKLDYYLKKTAFLSPLIFKPKLYLQDIPTLSHILGFLGKRFARLSYATDHQREEIPGVTHFFIPPEFDLYYQFNCPLSSYYYLNCSKPYRQRIEVKDPSIIKETLNKDLNISIPDLPDIFARNWQINVPVQENETVSSTFKLAYQSQITGNYPNLFANNFSQSAPQDLPDAEIAIPIIETEIAPKVLSIIDPFAKENDNTDFHKLEPLLNKPISPASIIFSNTSKIAETLQQTSFKEPDIQPIAASKLQSSLMQINEKLESKISSINYQNIEEIPEAGDNTEDISINSVSLPKSYNLNPAKIFEYPDNFPYDPTLLTQKFSCHTFSNLPFNTYISGDKVALKEDFPLTTFFKLAFGLSVNRLNISIKETTQTTFQQKIRNFSETLKHISSDVPDFQVSSVKEILPIRFSSAKLSDYRHGTKVSYSSDCLLDTTEISSLKELSRANFLKLSIFSTDESYRDNKIKLKKQPHFSFAKLFSSQKELQLSNPEQKRINEIEAPLEHLATRWSAIKSLTKSTVSGKSNISLSTKQRQPLLASYDVVLNTIPYRNLLQFPGFKYIQPQLTKIFSGIFEIIPSINNFKFKSQSKLKNEMYMKLDFPSSYPFRHKKIGDPEFIAKSDITQIIYPKIETYFPLFLNSSIGFIKERNLISPPITEVRQVKIPLFSSQSKLALKVEAQKSPLQIDLPNIFEILFSHLQTQLKLKLLSRLEENNPDSQKHAPELLPDYTWQTSDNKKQLRYSNKNYTMPSRLRLPLNRKGFKIINPRIRDLLKLAKQTSQKVSEVAHKMKI